MNDEDYLKHLIADKVSEMSEIEIHLFEYCNLSCSFCGQDHKNKEGMDSVVAKAKIVIDFMKKSPLKHHVINIMGGEIFNDDISDQMFVDYNAFCIQVNYFAMQKGLTVRFNFVTNLIFTKNIENVKYLLMYVENSMLSTSYDFAGRGLDINRMLTFKANLERFKDRIGVVGFVLTKPSIRKIISDKDKFFKEVLYKNFPLYFDWYVPEASAEKMMPTELEMLSALLYLAENYPNVEPVKSMLENEHNKMTCFSLNKTTILPSGKEVTCRYLEYEPSQFKTEIDYNSNSNIIQSHLNRHDCLSCSHYSRCQFRCFVQADWSNLERLPECFLKTFFDKTLGN